MDIYCDYAECRNLARYKTGLYRKNKKKSAQYCKKHINAISKKIPEIKIEKISIPKGISRLLKLQTKSLTLVIRR